MLEGFRMEVGVNDEQFQRFPKDRIRRLHGVRDRRAIGNMGRWGGKSAFCFSGGEDGSFPFATLISDPSGNLYGTTLEGGGGTSCRESLGCGTVFEIASG